MQRNWFILHHTINQMLKIMKLSNLSIVAIALLLLAACTKDGSPTPGTGGNPPGGGTTPPNKVIPTISNIYHIGTYYHFEADGDFSNIGTDISFKAKVTNAKSYDWDFGDGKEHSTDSMPTHTYVRSGAAYTVKLKVTSSSGDTATMKLPVSVNVYNGIVIDSLTAEAHDFAYTDAYSINFNITSGTSVIAFSPIITANRGHGIWTFSSDQANLPLNLINVDNLNFNINTPVGSGTSIVLTNPISSKYIWGTALSGGIKSALLTTPSSFFTIFGRYFNTTFHIQLNKVY